MLGAYFRVLPFNNSGTNSGGAGTITVKRKGWYIDTTGKPIWEASPVTMFSNAALLATAGYGLSTDCTPLDNGGATHPLIGAEFELVYTSTGSPTGPVQFYLQRSVDGGSTWPDNGQGEIIGTLVPSGAAAFKTVIEYD